MVQGKCIYCKKVKGINEEHAFPKSLLHNCAPLNACAPEWIIEKLCEDCNRALGKLDDTLVTKSPMGFIWRIIKSEWQTEKKRNSENVTFYSAKGYNGILPVGLFWPDHLYGNLIILHEEMGTSAPGFYPTLLGRARVPQMVLILHTERQDADRIIAENCEKWASGEISLEESDEYKGVYTIGDNCYVFDPQATKYFISGLDKEREFVTKFMTKHENIRFDLRALFPDNPGDAGKLNGFCTRLKASTTVEIGAKRLDPRESAENYVMVAADKKAIPYLKRAIAKIAFHCFLYWHRDFNGDEPIFEGIRSFISKNGNHQTLAGEEFVAGLDVQRSHFYSSNEHYHVFCFFVHGDNIVCQVVFFAGLWLRAPDSATPEPLASEVILAGKSDRARLGSPNEKGVPFYVHGKSQLKRRIIT